MIVNPQLPIFRRRQVAFEFVENPRINKVIDGGPNLFDAGISFIAVVGLKLVEKLMECLDRFSDPPGVVRHLL
jgi:hypothetical protein